MGWTSWTHCNDKVNMSVKHVLDDARTADVIRAKVALVC